jgi:two-component system sensor histidine kinase RpfC
LAEAVKKILQHLRTREDTEHEQALIRIGLSIFALVFLTIAYAVSGKTEGKTVVMAGAVSYFLFSIALFTAMLFNRKPSHARRLLGIMVDMGIVTFALMITEEVGAPLYGGYLWAIIANGFRFGKKYLYVAQFIAVVGFTLVISTGSFWHRYPMFGIGLLIWLVAIPPYVSVLLSKLEEAVTSAKRANSAKSRFLANMSHELRTPLNAIIGYSDLLVEEVNDNQHIQDEKDLRKIQQAGTHLLGLINEILDLSKIEENRMEVYVEDINVRELVAEVAGTIAPLASKNANQLQVDMAQDVGIIKTDIGKLRQVLFNLLSNACKFTSNGKISLQVSQQSEDKGRFIVFRVIDTGVGIDDDKMETIFMPFAQEDRSISTRYGGTGLGLAISKRFCEMLGGKLNLQSKKGTGSTFTVQLPLQFSVT